MDSGLSTMSAMWLNRQQTNSTKLLIWGGASTPTDSISDTGQIWHQQQTNYSLLFCQCCSCYRFQPYDWFRSPSSYMVSWRTVSGQSRHTSCELAQTGFHPIVFLWFWPVTDYEPHCRHVSINGIWRWAVTCPETVNQRPCMTREIEA